MTSTPRAYFDHNATTPMHPKVSEAMRSAMEQFGNPSSVHREGRDSRRVLEAARRQVAELLAADPHDLVFTGSGTEADVLGVVGLARLVGPDARLVTTRLEHPAIDGAIAGLVSGELATFRATCHFLEVDTAGLIQLESAKSLCSGPGVLCVSASNHELGTCQPLRELVDLARAAGMHVHVDAVQMAGKQAMDVTSMGADTVAVSGHKFYGPKGVGVLWVRPGLNLPPLVAGGHQERERRAGTHNILGAVGMGAAASLVPEFLDRAPDLHKLMQHLESELATIPDAEVHGKSAPRIGNTSLVSFAGAPGDAVVQGLDLAGFATSTGAACTSGSVEPSKVLLGSGFPEKIARSVVRFSGGISTTQAQVEALLAVIPTIVERARNNA